MGVISSLARVAKQADARTGRRAARRARSARSRSDMAPFPFRSRVAEEQAGPPKTLSAAEIEVEARERGEEPTAAPAGTVHDTR